MEPDTLFKAAIEAIKTGRGEIRVRDAFASRDAAPPV